MNFTQYFNPPEQIYLNSGSLNKCPKSVVEAVHRYVDAAEVNPTKSLFENWQNLWSLQKIVAEYFKANPKDLFLRPNVTYAMNDFIMGAELPAKGSIVISDLEYGAVVNICRLRAERDGRKLVSIKLKAEADAYTTTGEVVDNVMKQIPQDASLVMLSHVMTGTGLKLPIDEIGKELRKRGILFAVDGAHGPGAMPIEFDQLQNVDFYGGNLHKWFLGPKGSAFGWAHPSVQGKIKPIMGTWTMFPPVLEFFNVFGDGDHFALQMLMSHTNNFSSFYALAETIQFWKELGPENIYKRIYELQSHTHKTMTELFDWPLISPSNIELRGPLLTYKLPQVLQEKGYAIVLEMLEQHNVQLNVPMVHGEVVLRLSPHIYNTEEEITRGLTLFKKYCESLS
ncbi:MAG: aminotransferase class V-fold PLP-dependent enzyme [Bdellovibrionales bacterium]|nr:aminotransferase class V-fold PLP-dependent enzyme [Bdellovibrionales bacterium]